MKLQQIQTKNYVLLVDEEAEINEKPYFIWKDEVHKFHSHAGYGIKTWTDYNEEDGSSLLVNWSNKRKGAIAAYYPLTKEAKELEGLPLLPNPFKTEVNTEQLALKFFREANKHEIIFDLGWIKIFEAGYKAAQSKQFSLEDMKKIAQAAFTVKSNNDSVIEDFEKWFNKRTGALSTPQLPKEFIPEMVNDCIKTSNCIHCNSLLLIDDQLFCHICGKEAHKIYSVMKTITNSEGKQEVVGKYKY